MDQYGQWKTTRTILQGLGVGLGSTKKPVLADEAKLAIVFTYFFLFCQAQFQQAIAVAIELSQPYYQFSNNTNTNKPEKYQNRFRLKTLVSNIGQTSQVRQKHFFREEKISLQQKRFQKNIFKRKYFLAKQKSLGKIFDMTIFFQQHFLGVCKNY